MRIVIAYAAAVPILLAAVFRDLKEARIPNRWIAAGYLTGISVLTPEYGWRGILLALLRAAFPILLLYVLYRMRGLGAGDIKLFSVLSVFLGFHQIISVIFISLFFGAGISVIRLLANGQFILRMSNFMVYLKKCISQKEIVTYSTLRQRDSYIRFSVCILAGFCTVLLKEALIGRIQDSIV